MNKIIRYADVEMRMMENEDNVVVGVQIGRASCRERV